MMDWTDRHCRVFHRVLSRHALLYTEMVTAAAVVRGDRQRLLGFDPAENPVVLQLGGSDPSLLAEAAVIGEGFGYDEINLNVGCPSDRVQEGRFGACLMAEPALVARCVAAMQARVGIPVTVKCRIGIDDQDSDGDLDRFVATVADAGCRTFIVHARKAWLKGLSPKENREIPPLDYDRVMRLKACHPDLTIVLNGGLASLDDALPHLRRLDGVMLGRAAYQTPYLLASVDTQVFGEVAGFEANCRGSGAGDQNRAWVLDALRPYVAAHLAIGGRLNAISRHILGLYHGRPRGRAFRRHLSEYAVRDGAGLDVLERAFAIAEGAAGQIAAPGEDRLPVAG